jgi:predicted GTPase
MPHGAGYAAVRALGDATLVDPREAAVGTVAAVFEKFPHIGPVLPAMGYGAEQRRALKATIEGTDADVVVAATPADLARVLDLDVPVVRVRYDYADHGEPTLAEIVDRWARENGVAREPAAE